MPRVTRGQKSPEQILSLNFQREQPCLSLQSCGSAICGTIMCFRKQHQAEKSVCVVFHASQNH